MGQRQLQSLLKELIGSEFVYFQPPASIQMRYPAFVYSLDLINTKFANNVPYNHTDRYQVTLIYSNPDSIVEVRKKLIALPMCLFQRPFVKDNLNHEIYNLYF